MALAASAGPITRSCRKRGGTIGSGERVCRHANSPPKITQCGDEGEERRRCPGDRLAAEREDGKQRHRTAE